MKKEDVNGRMTNEEKAKEISFSQYKEYPYEGCDGLEYTNDSTIECEKSALEMAEWKDQQFKEYMNKKKEELDARAKKWLNTKNLENTAVLPKYGISLINEIINELFPEQDNSDNDK